MSRDKTGCPQIIIRISGAIRSQSMPRKYLSVLVPALYPLVVAAFFLTACEENQEQPEIVRPAKEPLVEVRPEPAPNVKKIDIFPTLEDTIEARKASQRSNANPEKLAAYARGIEAVVASGIESSALQVGAMAPDFTLPDARGGTVMLSEKLAAGPVVLTWYRGGWCPYCNLQLAAYQQILPQIEELGASLVALSPELPDKSLSTSEKNSLRFPVLTDLNLKTAREYGLVFKITPEVLAYYNENFSLIDYNGSEAAADELPLAATYIIAQDGKIAWAFLAADYTKRAEPQDILKALDGL